MSGTRDKKKPRQRISNVGSLIVSEIFNFIDQVEKTFPSEELEHFREDALGQVDQKLSPRMLVYLGLLSDLLFYVLVIAIETDYDFVADCTEEFLAEAHSIYFECLPGYEYDEQGLVLDFRSFGLAFLKNDKLFGGCNFNTKLFARKLVKRSDAIDPKFCLAEKYDRWKLRVIAEIITHPEILMYLKARFADTAEPENNLSVAQRTRTESLLRDPAAIKALVRTYLERKSDGPCPGTGLPPVGSRGIKNEPKPARALDATAEEKAWLARIPESSNRHILLHISRYGSISEMELNDFTGSPRRSRAFFSQLEEIRSLLPFRVNIDTSSNQKVLRKD